MGTKTYTQFGTFSVAVMLPLLLLFAVLMVTSLLANTPDFYVHVFLVLIFAACLLVFYKSTIKVDNTHVSFKLGIGLVGGSYKLSDIKSCRPVSNSALAGIGIRIIPNGMLYNVSGSKAIELQFHNKTSIVRIGTDKPEEISRHIQSLIAGEEITEEIPQTKTSKWVILFWTLLVLLILAFVMLPNYRDTAVQLEDKVLRIKGMYGLTIPYPEIDQIDTISSMPSISLRTNGYAFGKTLIGNFKLSDGSYTKLFVKKGFAPYIRITSRDRVPIYINFEEHQKTTDLYKELKARE